MVYGDRWLSIIHELVLQVHRLLHQKEPVETRDGWGEHCRDIYGPKAAGVDLFLLQKPTPTIQPNVKYNGPKNAETQGEVSYIFFQEGIPRG